MCAEEMRCDELLILYEPDLALGTTNKTQQQSFLFRDRPFQALDRFSPVRDGYQNTSWDTLTHSQDGEITLPSSDYAAGDLLWDDLPNTRDPRRVRWSS